MDSMTGTVTPNLMIIHANDTIQKSMVARIGSNVAAIQIVRRDLQVRRVLQVKQVPLAPKVLSV